MGFSFSWLEPGKARTSSQREAECPKCEIERKGQSLVSKQFAELKALGTNALVPMHYRFQLCLSFYLYPNISDMFLGHEINIFSSSTSHYQTTWEGRVEPHLNDPNFWGKQLVLVDAILSFYSKDGPYFHHVKIQPPQTPSSSFSEH